MLETHKAIMPQPDSLPSTETLKAWADKAEAELAAGWTDPHNDCGREFRELQVRQWRAVIAQRNLDGGQP